MDDLKLLREIRNDVCTAPEEAVASGRQKLMARKGADVAGTASAAKTPRRTVLRRGFAMTAAATLLVGGIVVADVVSFGGEPGVTAEAAEVLSDAAAATIQTSDPVVGPGQYLKIETTSVFTGGVLLGDDPNGPRRDVEWLDQYSDQLYIPADRSQEWIWNREARNPTTFFSEEAKAKAKAAKYQQSQTDNPLRTGELLRAPGGEFYENLQNGSRTLFAGLPLAEGVKNLPRDPQALLDEIRQRGKQGRPEAETMGDIAAALSTGAIPADLRAALYKAAALIPGVTVVDKQANLNGKLGTAIGKCG